MTKRIFTSQASKTDAQDPRHSSYCQGNTKDINPLFHPPSREASPDAYDCCEFHTALERFIHKWGRNYKEKYLTIEGCFAGDEEE